MKRNNSQTLVLAISLLATQIQASGFALDGKVRASEVSVSNPYAEVDGLAAAADLNNPKQLYQLVHESYRRGLYGTSRQWARKVLVSAPEHSKAREYLGFRQTPSSGAGQFVWKETFDWKMESTGLAWHSKLGWVRNEDFNAADQGMVRDDNQLVSVKEADGRHQTWETARIVESRYFRIRSTAPLEVMWFIAQDLDRLVSAYRDYFEIAAEPTTKPIVHLYRTSEDAEVANARKDWLERYGAYYQASVLHVQFQTLGALTAVRHEAGHALNRAFMSETPQWVDEGLGVFCQFAQPDADGSFRFGSLPPKHAFGKRYLERVQAGHKETLREAISEPHVVMDSDHYSKFRALVDFFMNSADRKYRKLFIDTVFRKQGRIRDLAELPNIDEEWWLYMKSLEPDPNWKYLGKSTEIEAVRQMLLNPRQ